MPPTKRHSLLDWLQQPSSWLSLIATVVSLTTVYLVNLSAGSLEVQLPEEVGVKANPNSTRDVDVLVPVVFYNTGAPRRQRIVTAISGELSPPNTLSLPLRWIDTQNFMGKIEYESRYPDKKIPNVQDYVVYQSRSVPFVVAGGDSEYKMLHLVPPTWFFRGIIRELTAFKLVLVVKTSDETFKVQGAYARQEGLSLGEYVWFTKAES